MGSKRVSVDLDELMLACEFASTGEYRMGRALICLPSGRIHLISDELGPDPEATIDFEQSEDFIDVPGRRELNLGRDVVLDFVAATVPQEWDDVREFFHRRGAYRQFKAWLLRRGLRDEWHAFEQRATEAALREWCEDNDVEVVDTANRPGGRAPDSSAGIAKRRSKTCYCEPGTGQ